MQTRNSSLGKFTKKRRISKIWMVWLSGCYRWSEFTL